MYVGGIGICVYDVTVDIVVVVVSVNTVGVVFTCHHGRTCVDMVTGVLLCIVMSMVVVYICVVLVIFVFLFFLFGNVGVGIVDVHGNDGVVSADGVF